MHFGRAKDDRFRVAMDQFRNANAYSRLLLRHPFELHFCGIGQAASRDRALEISRSSSLFARVQTASMGRHNNVDEEYSTLRRHRRSIALGSFPLTRYDSPAVRSTLISVDSTLAGRATSAASAALHLGFPSLAIAKTLTSSSTLQDFSPTRLLPGAASLPHFTHNSISEFRMNLDRIQTEPRISVEHNQRFVE
jgi:hypothetical protein